MSPWQHEGDERVVARMLQGLQVVLALLNDTASLQMSVTSVTSAIDMHSVKKLTNAKPGHVLLLRRDVRLEGL